MGNVVYKKCLGVNNTDPQHRLTPTLRGYYLTDCSNVHIDNTHAVVSREGCNKLDNDSYHSTENIDGIVLGVVNGSLCRILPDLGLTTIILTEIHPSIQNAEWSYTKVGDRIRASNSFMVGDIMNDIYTEIPTTIKPYKHRFPAGKNLCYYRGRIYTSIENIILCSDAMDWNVVDEREDTSYIERPNKITMLGAVDDGIWGSDEECVFFLKGAAPEEFIFDRKTSYPALKGTLKRLKSVWLPTKPTYQPLFVDTAIMFTTTEGICIGGNGGVLVNLTIDYYSMPTGLTEGCSLIKKGNINQYISILR